MHGQKILKFGKMYINFILYTFNHYHVRLHIRSPKCRGPPVSVPLRVLEVFGLNWP